MSPGLSPAEQLHCPMFLAYAREDEQHMRLLSRAIEEIRGRSGELWADLHLKPGEKWDREILQQIHKSRIFIALISGRFWGSGECRKELNYALDSKVLIFPVLLEDMREQEEEFANLPQFARRAAASKGARELTEAAEEIAALAKKLSASIHVSVDWERPVGERFPRLKELDHLDLAFSRSRIVVITGRAGVGKTELARQFAWRDGAQPSIGRYLDATSPKLDRGIIRIARIEEPLLVILDNISRIHHALRLCDRLPAHAQILILSRVRAWRDVGVVVPINAPDREDCIDFLARRVPKHRFERHELGELVDSVSRLPLALETAADALLKCMKIDRYLDKVCGVGPQACWTEAVERLDRTKPEASLLIRLLSFARRDEIRITEAYDQIHASHLDLIETKTLGATFVALESHGLGTYLQGDDEFNLHTLVRSCVRNSIYALPDRLNIADLGATLWDGTENGAFASYCAGLLYRGRDEERALSLLQGAVTRADEISDPLAGVYRYCHERQRKRMAL